MNHRDTETQRTKSCFRGGVCLVDPSVDNARILNAKSAKTVHRKGRKAVAFSESATRTLTCLEDRKLGLLGGWSRALGSGGRCHSSLSARELNRVRFQMRCFAMVYAHFAFFAFQTWLAGPEWGSGTRDHRRLLALSVSLCLCGENR